MTESFEIQVISAQQTYPLRQAILRQGFPPETCVFPGDENLTALHFGAVGQTGEIIGVASLYREPIPDDWRVALAGDEGVAEVVGYAGAGADTGVWRLRGMAVAESARGLGVGKALLAACLDHTRAHGRLLWCNARTPAVDFYRRHGLVTLGEEFDIPTAGPHYRMAKVLRRPVSPPG